MEAGKMIQCRRQHSKSPVLLALITTIIITILPSSYSRNYDYGEALSKSLLYFETQRSGHLPHHQRVTWRHHSALLDGLHQSVRYPPFNVDLVGGYYDAGDNVKFGFPMAFTVTMLSWGVLNYGGEMAAASEYEHALEAIKWGTDYFIKSHTSPNVLWVEVGDGDTDHQCWQRPEDMTTSRRAYKVDEGHPGSDVAAETAAAMAAAAMVFRTTNPQYSDMLLDHSIQLFEFGDKYRGNYDASIREVKKYYPSVSGYKDELLWAALWLYKATQNKFYLDYVVKNAIDFGGTTWSILEFSWDVKFAGVQILASMLEEGKNSTIQTTLKQYKSKAEYYLCGCLHLNKGKKSNVRRTPGGLLYTRRWNNMQYVSNAAFLLTVYSDHLVSTNQTLSCPRGKAGPQELLSLATSQVEYILGSNPRATSYLVGFGPRYPMRVHHRGSSVVSYKENRGFIGCTQGYDDWYKRAGPNPNLVVGALVGGPDSRDRFGDDRGNFVQTEACTYNTASLVGVLAKLRGFVGLDSCCGEKYSVISSF
ncbi:hypothetical protein V2J09_017278 [Rumex salicifolius]